MISFLAWKIICFHTFLGNFKIGWVGALFKMSYYDHVIQFSIVCPYFQLDIRGSEIEHKRCTTYKSLLLKKNCLHFAIKETDVQKGWRPYKAKQILNGKSENWAPDFTNFCNTMISSLYYTFFNDLLLIMYMKLDWSFWACINVNLIHG